MSLWKRSKEGTEVTVEEVKRRNRCYCGRGQKKELMSLWKRSKEGTDVTMEEVKRRD